MSSLRAAVASGATRLAEAGVPSPEADARTLLAHALGTDAAGLDRAMILCTAITPEVRERFDGLIASRCERVPLQHLTGRAPFHHVEVEVGPGAFVPRPETELLVDLALERLGEDAVVVDLCTGSGAIAVAIAAARPGAQVYAVELDPLAHAWAQRNVENSAPKVDLQLGDAREVFPGLEGCVDVVTCNPPYVPDGQVPREVEAREHDPALALYGGSADGLRLPVEMADRAWVLLRPGGWLIMEHAETQGESLPAALTRRGWSDVGDHQDLNGRPRTTTARKPLSP